MPIINPTLPSDGDDITEESNNNPLITILALLNGNLDADNLANGAVTALKLATGAVTGAKLGTGIFQLAYAAITTDFSTTSTSATQATGLTTGAVTLPTRSGKLKISAFTSLMYNGSAGNYVIMSIWDGTVGSGTKVAEAKFRVPVNDYGAPAFCKAVITNPASGSKTYNVGFQTGAGTGVLSAASTAPAYIDMEFHPD